MQRLHSSKVKVFLISTLLVVGLVTSPARADHEHSNNLIAPLAGLLVLGAFLNNNHYYYKRSKRYNGGHGFHGHRYGHRARSYSSEGFGRKSKRNYSH